MFGFLLRKKQDDVRSLFAGYVNRNAVQRMADGQGETSRSPFCEVVWLIPLDAETREPQFPAAVPVVTKDICQEGLSILHTRSLDDQLVMIGLEGDVSMRYVACRIENCSPMGYGFCQIDLLPQQVIDLSAAEEHDLQRRQRLFEENLSADDTI